MVKQYKLYEGSIQEAFQNSRSKIQVFGGGFGNGKTTSAVVKTLEIAKDYPGANILLARSTYPKLNDTLRKEFLAWCPPSWIESKNLSQENVVRLTNGTTINFRYISQQGKSEESSTSNLLSATYDLIVVDQIEDPEIAHKDFLDLLGRLRGNTRYVGEKTDMPVTGPRWMIITCNPTRNWVYRELVKPLHDLKIGRRNDKLLADPDGKPIIAVFEGSTYSNQANLPEDFISTMEASYKGQMKSRFLMGEWGAYEGLVYPEYDPQIHRVPHGNMLDYLREISYAGYVPKVLEAYDHGIAQPACYGQAFVDYKGNVFLFQGLYQREQTVEALARAIKQLRSRYSELCVFEPDFGPVLADPAVFKRSTGTSKKVGTTVARLFDANGVPMTPANNAIVTGIMKIKQMLTVDPTHVNPFTKTFGSPRLFVSDNLDFFDKEIVDYVWKKDTSGENEDTPRDKNDHSLDMLKYMLSKEVKLATASKPAFDIPPKALMFHEIDIPDYDNSRSHRYGA